MSWIRPSLPGSPTSLASHMLIPNPTGVLMMGRQGEKGDLARSQVSPKVSVAGGLSHLSTAAQRRLFASVPTWQPALRLVGQDAPPTPGAPPTAGSHRENSRVRHWLCSPAFVVGSETSKAHRGCLREGIREGLEQTRGVMTYVRDFQHGSGFSRTYIGQKSLHTLCLCVILCVTDPLLKVLQEKRNQGKAGQAA